MKSVLRTFILAPFSWLYGLGLVIRHFLYNEHMLPSYHMDVATICVGNLTAGGTGKTPMTEYLIRLLSPNYKVAVLSRGYKRKTRGFRLANSCDDAITIGDEPMLMHQHFPNIPIAVCRDRVEGIKHLKQIYPDLECVILDDAMQHRRLQCGYYILLTAYNNLYHKDHLLPLGRLRDLKNRSEKAQTIVISKCPSTLAPIEKRIVANSLHIYPFQQLCFSKMRYFDVELPGTPLIVTGIAHPEYLLQHIQKTWPKAELMAYKDHHLFSENDINDILKKAAPYTCIVTTEKDLMRFQQTSFLEQLGDALYVQPLEMDLGSDKEDFDRKILLYVKENAHKKK